MSSIQLKNAKSLPEVFYGLHMVEGVAEYAEPEKKPYRIYIGEEAIRNMNPTFQGKPVYVDHVDEIDLENLEAEADGYVVRSFFNKADGKTWVEFLAVSDKAKEAIKLGWKLSNAYIPKAFAGGGENHGVRYEKEVTAGEYEHLAIVQNPRYEESVILTPEEFKAYNAEKEAELLRLTNSKDQEEETTKVKLNFFKKQKVENSADVSDVMVTLPLCKKDMSVSDIITAFDKIENMSGYANGDHMVKVGEDEMSVNDLVKKHIEMCNKMSEMENAGEGEPGVDIENDEDEEGTVAAGMKDVDSRGGDKSLDNEGEDDKPEQDGAKEKKKNAKAEAERKAAIKEKVEKLKNAKAGREEETAVVDLGMDKIARGKARYGSN